MKSSALITVLGLVLALGGSMGIYLSRTFSYREVCASAGVELAWIKMEFDLDEATFERVRQLHEAYKPVCEKMCLRIDEKNRALASLLAIETHLTPEMEKLLAEAAQLRGECQKEMLRHFFAVSQAMPPDQGRRYLTWMQEQTLSPTHPSMLPRAEPNTSGYDHRH